MTNIYSRMCIIFIVCIISINYTYSQLTNKWEVADYSKIKYNDSYKLMDYFDENDIVVFGNISNNNSSAFLNNNYQITRFKNKCQTKEIIYFDTTNISDYFLNIKHPTSKIITVVGYNGNLLGKFSGSNVYLTSGLLLLSIDSGASWKRTVLDSNTILMDISMCDSMNGAIIQNTELNPFNQNFPYNYNSDTVLITNDCWQSYKKVGLPDGIKFTSQIFCLSPDNIVVLSLDIDKQQNFLIATKNGGNSWNILYSFDSNYYIRDLKFMDNNIIHAVGNRDLTQALVGAGIPKILKSYDGGNTWNEAKKIFNNASDLDNISNIDFSDSLNGIVNGQHKFLRTSDGGNTWFNEDVPYEFSNSDSDIIKQVLIPNEDFAVAVLPTGIILICKNEKILKKPDFYGITNSFYQNVNNLKQEWTHIDGAIKYRLILEGLSKDSMWVNSRNIFEHLIIDTIVTDTSIVFSKVYENYQYKCLVKAIGEGIESDWSSTPIYGTEKSGSLNPPWMISPVNNEIISPGDITLVWHSIVGVDYYNVVVYKSAAGEYFSKYEIPDTMITMKNSEAGSGYSVRLQSQTKDSMVSVWSSSFFYTWYEPLDVIELINLSNNSLNIFPNPVSQNFKIKINTEFSSFCLINVYGLLGNKVFSTNTFLTEGDNIVNINIVDIFPGLYSVEVLFGKNVRRGLFIKE